MNKNIIYCICSYLERDRVNLTNVLTSAKNMPRWAERHNIDCELITEIPSNIEDMVESIKMKWWPKQPKNIRKFSSKIHRLKAWNTKYEVIHKFYNSDYEKMTYIDCDFVPAPKKLNTLNFDKIPTGYYMHTRKKPTVGIMRPPISTVEKHLKRQISYRYIAGVMYLTKQFKHNLSKVFDYNKIYKLWEKDEDFIREETSLNYILFNENIAQDITPITKHTKFLKHIGGRALKGEFVYENQWGV